ncbi:ATP-binding protein [Paraburkholderia sp. SIMBA_049]
MSDTNLYRCTPRQLRGFITDCLFAGLVPNLIGPPGVGKSAIARNVADELHLSLIDHRLSTSAPEDLSGLPRFDEDGKARFAPFADLFPLTSHAVPKGKEGWMLFLDEFNSASKSVQAAAYKLVLDRMVGQHRLHDQCVIVAAGNRAEDRAIVNNLSTAMQSRLVHLELEVSFEEWLYDVALKEKYDSRIIAYLSQYPSKLMDFRPDHNEKTFCCPRTWEFMNRLVKDQPVTEAKAPLYAGTVTSGVAVDFITFTQVYQNIVKIDQVIRDPHGTPVPVDNNSKWATISHLMEGVNELNFNELSTYADRFDLSFRILFMRAVMVQHPELRQHPAFARSMGVLSRYLNG